MHNKKEFCKTVTLIFLAISCITPMTLNLYRKKYEDQKRLLKESCGRGKKKMVGEKFKTAAVITKKASNQHLFLYCVLTIKFPVFLKKIVYMVNAYMVYLVVLKTTIKTAQHCHCFIIFRVQT